MLPVTNVSWPRDQFVSEWYWKVTPRWKCPWGTAFRLAGEVLLSGVDFGIRLRFDRRIRKLRLFAEWHRLLDSYQFNHRGHPARPDWTLWPQTQNDELGTNLEYFHAAEDRQAVRDEVFSIIQNLDNIRADSVVVDKRKTGPSIRSIDKFYPIMLENLLN